MRYPEAQKILERMDEKIVLLEKLRWELHSTFLRLESVEEAIERLAERIREVK